MSVIVRGMEMPENCDECRFSVDGWCVALVPEDEREITRIYTGYCPLTEVKIPECGLNDRTIAVYVEQGALMDFDRILVIEEGTVWGRVFYEAMEDDCK